MLKIICARKTMPKAASKSNDSTRELVTITKIDVGVLVPDGNGHFDLMEPDGQADTGPSGAWADQQFHGPFDAECFAQWLSHCTHPGEEYSVEGPLDELEDCGAQAVDGKLVFQSAHKGEAPHAAQATKRGKVVSP